jgi:Zn finger protein HypA/HybF involved in hydrogenase expression
MGLINSLTDALGVGGEELTSYRCNNCNTRFSESADLDEVECPHCQGTDIRR